MSARFDLAVVGAGPAGSNAAIAARQFGLRTVVIDEAADAGGQVWRAPQSIDAKPVPEGDRLRDRLAQSGAELVFGRRLWLAENGFVLHLIGDPGRETIKAERLIVASGASERIVPFPGWTSPRVIGLAATTILLKSHGTLPGMHTLVAGRGPLLSAVASGILELGGQVAAIVDASGHSDWLGALAALRRRPADLRTGLGWWLKLKRHRVPWIAKSHIEQIEPGADNLRVLIAGRDEPVICDAVAVGDGLTPAAEIVRLLGGNLHYEESLGGWIPSLDNDGRSSVVGLYACGDSTGIRGAAVACEMGRLAGFAAARDAGALDPAEFARFSGPIHARLDRIAPAAAAMAGLMSVEADRWSAIPGGTTVCRCEDVTKDMLRAAIEQGARDADQLKAWTRCGMGPCQGRMCGEAAAQILARAAGIERSAVQPWTARAPFRPIAMEDVLGEFDYADIPIPAAAPL